MPQLIREPCEAAPLPPPPSPTSAQLEEHALGQVAMLDACNQKRELGVYVMDVHNAYVDRLVTQLRPARGWEHVFGKKRPPPVPKPTFERLTTPD